MEEQAISDLVRDVLDVDVLAVRHMNFGHNSLTYDVQLPERHIMVRTHHNASVFAHTERNITLLARLGLPVPHIITTDLTMTHVPFGYMLLDKIPGRDLRYELAAMSHEQMTVLAQQIVSFQHKVMALAPGRGYGFVAIGGEGPYASWLQLIKDAVYKSLSVVRQGPLGEKMPDIGNKLSQFEAYLEHVPPTCFLDDLTTKNVLIQHGRLQGCIDFDCVCYGDPLFNLSLTQTGVLSDVGEPGLFYVEELCRCWQITEQQRQVVNFYSAIHAIDFLKFQFEDPGEGHGLWTERMLKAINSWLEL
ncbi:hypothetical protein KDA_66030 [Dictyobacter alpinus]|uniref:Aminoglycoside phosphotransferase domain-containing protein n=1 Tax=Dictyobacter alpinus TaxID=2014873 RepID=A0A402BIF0_9CHLR|nr:aminoglycoside phosphotransferase family protein [Dictyobacter alpinus]GCE31119.1 hypothetical protein KDA_66030 [Dictyobacter alpinus]